MRRWKPDLFTKCLTNVIICLHMFSFVFMCGRGHGSRIFTDLNHCPDGFQSLTWQVCRTYYLSSLCSSSSRSSASCTTRTCTLFSSSSLPSASHISSTWPALTDFTWHWWGHFITEMDSRPLLQNRCEMIYTLSVKLRNMFVIGAWKEVTPTPMCSLF